MSCQEIELPHSCEVGIQRDQYDKSYSLFYLSEGAHRSFLLELGKCYRFNGQINITEKNGIFFGTNHIMNLFIIGDNSVVFSNSSKRINMLDSTIKFNVIIPKPGGRKRSRISRRK